jgi:predicted transglutaminase-like cysteine proteinase
MCVKTPAECVGGGQSSVAATAALVRLLHQVNAAVNAAIVPRSDGARDAWQVGVSSGDCEDYVLAKRRALIEAGLDASALRFAYVKTAAGEGHAILVVRTSKGDLVLDNLEAQIRPLEASGYGLVSMSGANPRVWN